MTWVDKFISYLTPGHVEVIFLYLLSCAILTAVQIYFLRQWSAGLKGINGHWEGPEVLLYICIWVWPSMLYADIFLQLKASDMVWYIFGAALFFGLTGRFGLEWILAFKNNSSQVTTTTEKKTTTKIENGDDKS